MWLCVCAISFEDVSSLRWAKHQGYKYLTRVASGDEFLAWHLSDNLKMVYTCRRKFRSQTSDNMDRWKAEEGRGREKRKIRRKKSRRERVRRKKMQMREKVGKSRNTAFFQWFGAPEGRKVGSLKRRVRSQLARWEMKNCTPLRREAHLQVKMCKTPGSIALFLMLSSSKIEEVSQNCFFVEVVKFKNCRRLLELFRFCCCQRRKMRKSRRSASFFKLADRQGDR